MRSSRELMSRVCSGMLNQGRRSCQCRRPQLADEHRSENGGVPWGGQRGFLCSRSNLMALVRLGVRALNARSTHHSSDWHVAWDYVDIRKIADLGELGEHP